jgi:adenosylhomocysteine nucleosidase
MRKCSYLIFILFIIGCGVKNRPIGIMGALDSEISLVKSAMDVEEEIDYAGRTCIRGKLKGKEIILVKAGVGKVNASLTTQILIEKFDIRSLIFTGVAGGIDTSLHIGDMVISSRVIQHDYGHISPEGFQPTPIRLPRKGDEVRLTHFQSDSFLIEIAKIAAINSNMPASPFTQSFHERPKVIVGTIVTGDQFIASESKRRWLDETFQASCVEMEGGAVAQVCTTFEVPFVILRSLSDLANENATVDFRKFVDYASKNSASIIIQMVDEMNGNQ